MSNQSNKHPTDKSLDALALARTAFMNLDTHQHNPEYHNLAAGIIEKAILTYTASLKQQLEDERKVSDLYRDAWNGYKVFPSMSWERKFEEADSAHAELRKNQSK